MLARLLPLLLFIGMALPAIASTLAGKRPNIIFILTDDQGYGDISAHGSPILKTPNLDRLHDEGVRFADFHVSPTCAPTRSVLMTGRHEFRNGVTHTIYERERLTLDAVTLPQILKTAGYTTGIFGKWHLGDEPEYWPSARGFDEMFIHGGGGIGQTYPGSCGDAPGNTYFNPAILHNGTFVKTEGYCTDIFFKEAIQWIDEVKGKQPFYCQIATNAPHTPLEVKPENEARYTGKVPPPPAGAKGPFGQPGATEKFYGMVANIDDNVGTLLKKLAEWDIERDTLVIFMNDNGGTAGVRIFNAGMHGSKASPWLGGTRAASFWRWPGTLEPDEVTSLTAHLDFLPTLAEIAGAKLSDKAKSQIEGRSLVPLLLDPTAAWNDRTLITHVGRWQQGQSPETGKYTQCSVRTTQWHLVNPSAKNVKAWELYDVKADPGEMKNIASDHPQVVTQLEDEFEKWWANTLPLMVNENIPLAAANPFRTLYEKQFGKAP